MTPQRYAEAEKELAELVAEREVLRGELKAVGFALAKLGRNLLSDHAERAEFFNLPENLRPQPARGYAQGREDLHDWNDLKNMEAVAKKINRLHWLTRRIEDRRRSLGLPCE